MWQTIVVYIIGAIVFGYVLFKVYRMVTRASDPCIGCGGCELKSLMQQSDIDFRNKQQTCRTDNSKRRQKQTKRSSCCTK